jgi:hypothetical protein
MVTRVWIGGGSNSANNPADWSPTGVPQPGDSLSMSAGTIDVTGGSLAGDSLALIPPAIAPFDATINLTNDAINLGVGNQSFAMQAIGAASPRFIGGNGVGLSANVMLSASSLVMTGTVGFIYGFNVGGTGRIVNDGTVTLTNSKIGTDVSGSGTFDLTRYHDGPGNTEIVGSVGAGLIFDLEGEGGSFPANLTIDNPFTFQALIEVNPPSLPDIAVGGDTVKLAGLSATSYTFTDDTLTLFNQDSVVTRLRLESALSFSVVQNTPLGDRPSINLDFGTNDPGAGLPIHQSLPPPPKPAPPPTTTPPTVTPPVTTTPPDPATVLGAFDTTTGQTVVAIGDQYPGPVAGLLDQYINTTSDNINITASSPNWFIHSGSGEDAIAASGGTNVLDGGTGSNFLTGGSGMDTFFVDDRGATADIWSTVVGFHSGDSATVWGVTPQDFALNFVDGQGAGGFTGLTLHATAAGKPTASLTLAGFTQADMNSGRLSVQFGTDPASGSAFMFIHANS